MGWGVEATCFSPTSTSSTTEKPTNHPICNNEILVYVYLERRKRIFEESHCSILKVPGLRARICKRLRSPRMDGFKGIDSASLCSLADLSPYL